MYIYPIGHKADKQQLILNISQMNWLIKILLVSVEHTFLGVQ